MSAPTVETGDPASPEVAGGELELQLIDISRYQRELARDHADRVLADRLGQGGLRGVLNKVWYSAMGAGEGVRAKAFRQGLEQINNAENLFVLEGDDISSEATIRATLDRFGADIEDGLVRTEPVGEDDPLEKRMMLEAGNESHDHIRDGIRHLIDRYISGEITDDNFNEEKNQFLRGISRGNADMFGRGALFADNLFDVAQTIKQSAEHRANLDDIVSQMKIVTGDAKLGSRAEAELSRTERLAENIAEKPVFGAASALLIAGATTGLAKKAGVAGARSASAALMFTGAFAAVGGGLAAVRERTRLARDRARNMREHAQGKEDEHSDLDAMPEDTVMQRRAKRAARRARERRLSIEATRYDTVAANELTDTLESYYDPEGGELLAENEQEYADAMASLVSAITVNRLSDHQNIDLIHYSSIDQIELERMEMDMAIATLQVRLREKFADFNPDSEQDFDTLLDAAIATESANVTSYTSEQDALFSRLRAVEGAKAFAKGAAFGVTAGLVIQEAAAQFQDGGWAGNVIGLGEDAPASGEDSADTLLRGIVDGSETQSILDDAAEGAGDSGTDAVAGGESEITQSFADTYTYSPSELVNLQLPEGMQVDQIGPAESNVFEVSKGSGADKEIIGRIVLNENGEITAESLDSLEAASVTIASEDVPFEAFSGESSTLAYDDLHQIRFPKEYEVSATGDNQFSIADSNGNHVAVIDVDPETGLPTAESIANLPDDTIEVAYATNPVAGTPEMVTVPLQEYLENHHGESEHVTRVLWYGNDTPSPVFDLNELQTHAGGENGTWFDAGGNVVVDITGMTDTGSFQGGEIANVSDLVEDGELKAAISVSTDTQAEVFTFDINYDPATGRTTAVIDGDHGIASLFETTPDGGRQFNGGYIEIMELTGETADNGAEEVRVLSTFVGENNATSLTEVISTPDVATTVSIEPTPRSLESHTLDFGDLVSETETDGPEAVPGVPADTLVDGFVGSNSGEVNPAFGPFITPIRGMEALGYRPRAERAYYYGYGRSPEEMRRRRREMSPRLRRDAGAQLSTGVETSWYRDELERRRGLAYLREIEEQIEAVPELSDLAPDTKAIVTIPVAAASESENIYNALSVYAKQDGDAISQTTILLHLNWIDDMMSDADIVAKMDQTRAEIERARRDFPDLKIAVMETEFERSFVERRGAVIGEVARRMYDTAMVAVNRAIAENGMEADQEVLLIRNDADHVGLSREYVQKVVDAAQSGESDVFTGGVRWDTEKHQQFAGFGVITNFDAILNAVKARKGEYFQTRGANTAVKISALAAVGSVGFGDYIGAGSDDLEIGGRVEDARTGRTGAGYANRSVINPGSENRLTRLLNLRQLQRERGDAGSKPVKYVTGFQVDTNADRLLDLYRSGETVVGAWNGFDDGGYAERGGDGGSIDRDDVRGDFDSVAQRIEDNISAMSTDWVGYGDRALVQSALRFMFPEKVPGEPDSGRRDAGQKIYDLKWEDGRCSFALTPAGKRWLQAKLERDSSGRYDMFGKRVRRALYHEVSPKSVRTPKSTQPRMVSATS